MDKMEVKDTTANPAPLGLLGFGMPTVLLSLYNAGICSFGAVILAMAIFYGGLAQVIAGIQEWKKNNTFGATAFTSYGMFWLTFVTLELMPKHGWWGATERSGIVSYLVIWGIFTLVMFIGTLKLSRALQVVFGSLALLYFLLAWGDAARNETITRIAGCEGIFCGLSAIYTGLAQLLNEVYGRRVLPLGVPK